MADKLTPITRLEGILAGQDITPITRLEHFLKQYAGGGGSGGGVYVVNLTGNSPSNFAFDKTASEVFAAKQIMPVVVTASFSGATLLGDLVIAVKQGTNYTFFAYVGGNDLSEFAAASDDSYPAIQA